MRSEAFTTMKMPADIGPNQLGRVHCKVDTGAGGNVMPLHVFQKLFPSQLDANSKPTGLCPTVTQLTAYNGSAIPQLGAHDTAIKWRPSSSGPPRCPHPMVHSRHVRTCYIRPPIILKYWSHAAWTVPYNLHRNGKTHPTCQEDQPLSTRKSQVTLCTSGNWQHSADDHPFVYSTPARTLIPAYPDCFEGIGCFPGTYTIHLHDNAKPVIHAPYKCPLLCIHLCVRRWMNSWSRRS